MGEIYGKAEADSSERAFFLPAGKKIRSFALQTQTNPKWNSAQPALSVVILGFRRADLLARAISSFRAHSTLEDWELVLVLNGASAEVLRFSAELLANADFPLLVLEASGRRPGAARNLGVAQARGELLLFLDDDIECFQDLGKAASALFRDPALLAAGGANLTPPDSGALERAAGFVLASYLGAASMRGRYRQLAEGPSGEHALILCNLAIRREAFFAQGGFATHLISNEENVLLQQLDHPGTKLWHSPRLAVYHRRRETWAGTWEQAAKYGAGRAQNLLLLPHTLRPLYFLPTFFLFYLLCLPYFSASPLAFLPLVSYALLVALFTTSFATRDRAGWLAAGLFPWIHLAYGFGFARALLSWGLRRKKLLEHAL